MGLPPRPRHEPRARRDAVDGGWLSLAAAVSLAWRAFPMPCCCRRCARPRWSHFTAGDEHRQRRWLPAGALATPRWFARRDAHGVLLAGSVATAVLLRARRGDCRRRRLLALRLPGGQRRDVRQARPAARCRRAGASGCARHLLRRTGAGDRRVGARRAGWSGPAWRARLAVGLVHAGGGRAGGHRAIWRATRGLSATAAPPGGAAAFRWHRSATGWRPTSCSASATSGYMTFVVTRCASRATPARRSLRSMPRSAPR